MSRKSVLASYPVILSYLELRSSLLTNHTGQISEVLTEQWNALSDREKGPYEEMAIKDTKRYEDEQPAARVSVSGLVSFTLITNIHDRLKVTKTKVTNIVVGCP